MDHFSYDNCTDGYRICNLALFQNDWQRMLMNRHIPTIILSALLVFLIPYVGYRIIWGNAKTRAVRAIGETIIKGDTRLSALQKIDKMRSYDAEIHIRPAIDAKEIHISVLSCPGYDHYLGSFLIDGDFVTESSH